MNPSLVELLSGLFLMGWGLYSFVCLGGLFWLTRRLWKDDWFWLIVNKGYYLGWLLDLGYGLALVPLLIWSQDWSLPIAFAIQLPISIFLLSKYPSRTKQERMAYFAFPFFTLPIWFALKHARKTRPEFFVSET